MRARARVCVCARACSVNAAPKMPTALGVEAAQAALIWRASVPRGGPPPCAWTSFGVKPYGGALAHALASCQ